MKKVALAALLWLSASVAMALPSQGVPAFQKSSANWSALESDLKKEDALHGDMVDVDKTARGLQKWYASKNRLTEAGKDPEIFAKTMVEAYGEKLWVEDFKRLANTGRFFVPFTVATLVPVNVPADDKAVSAASAPTKVAEVAQASPVQTGAQMPEAKPLAPAAATTAAPAVTALAQPVVEVDKSAITSSVLGKWAKFAQQNDERIAAQADAFAILQGRLDEMNREVQKLRQKEVTAKLSKVDQDKLDSAIQQLEGLKNEQVSFVSNLKAEIESLQGQAKKEGEETLRKIEAAATAASKKLEATNGQLVGRMSEVEKRVEENSNTRTPAVLTAIALLAAIAAGGLAFFRTRDSRLEKVSEAVVTEALKPINRDVATLKRVTGTDVRSIPQGLENDLGDWPIDKEKVYRCDVRRGDGQTVPLDIIRVDLGSVKITGIQGHRADTNPVLISRLRGIIERADQRGDLVGVGADDHVIHVVGPAVKSAA